MTKPYYSVQESNQNHLWLDNTRTMYDVSKIINK